jgi:hypothetical protein
VSLHARARIRLASAFQVVFDTSSGRTHIAISSGSDVVNCWLVPPGGDRLLGSLTRWLAICGLAMYGLTEEVSERELSR